MTSARISIFPCIAGGRALRLSPRARQILPFRCSRASCIWSHNRPFQPLSLRSSWTDYPKVGSKWQASFGTSAAHLTDGQQSKPTPVPISDKEQKNPKTITKAIKSKLAHEQIYNLPNLLTFSRLISTPVLGWLIINDHPLYALSLFIYAGTSDLLDGWIARRWKLQTVVGSVVDPMADKALMTTVVTCLAINGSLSLPLATLILGRDISLAIAAIYYRYASLPSPKTFTRYWDFSLPSAEVHPTTISKLNTFLQLILIGSTMCVSLLHDPAALDAAANVVSTPLLGVKDVLGGMDGVDALVKGMSGVVAATTVYSGLSYAWLKDAVTILGEDEKLKKRQGFRGRMIIAGTFGSVVLIAAGLWWKELQGKVVDDVQVEK
ncbi:hypothetical protein DM02DRAFT_612232 [Periconia macrospinosa]|uniref:Cardiolipin synthetase n=1 Tax=Periconia macrospinosa TaxID=97972 RepID=A0A2V1DZH1_9PLEO|nr:hypothetical protein DM02DRAFT_612232 [Periconia macrospinosa]